MTSAPHKRVTTLDVARHAGVSKTTVSYVVNDTPNQSIPQVTRDRVLRAIRELGYVPHSGARALRRGHADTVLLVMPDWPPGRVLALIVDALAEDLGRRGLTLLIRRQRSGQPLMTMWQELNPAGIVTPGVVEEADQRALRKAGVLLISASPTTGTTEENQVAANQERIGHLQVQHLASRGHRHLAWFGPADPRFRVFRDLRLAGARRACEELELPAPDVVDGEPTTSSASAAIRRWVGATHPSTAAVSYNDDFAGALLSGLTAAGRTAPHDLAIIGVDNEPLSRFTTPPLTTVDQNHRTTATHLGQLLAHGLLGEAPPPPLAAAPLTLIERGTT